MNVAKEYGKQMGQGSMISEWNKGVNLWKADINIGILMRKKKERKRGKKDRKKGKRVTIL